MSFMFESTYILKLTDWALTQPVDKDYMECWQDVPREFDSKKKVVPKTKTSSSLSSSSSSSSSK
jgi:hypothetical protein